MSRLTDALTQIERWLIQNFPKEFQQWQPGLARSEIDALIKDFPFPFPEELYELYQWHNGGDSAIGFIPPFDTFWSLQQALEYYQGYLRDEEWNRQWFPLMSENGNWEYGVVLGKEAAPVWFYYGEGGAEEIHWDSLTDLCLAAVEAYKSGIYYREAAEHEANEEAWYFLALNEEKYLPLYRKYGYRSVEADPHRAPVPDPISCDPSEAPTMEDIVQMQAFMSDMQGSLSGMFRDMLHVLQDLQSNEEQDTSEQKRNT